ncbi:hypothetical protein [Sphingomonas sp.]|uniref:hypothetical protein n=1 Tax=Sphingomonas sp. TaxID=28214 RepID=UPI003CC620DB
MRGRRAAVERSSALRSWIVGAPGLAIASRPLTRNQTAGASTASFGGRRQRDPGFAREMRIALDEGCERLELALIAEFQRDSHDGDSWHYTDRPELPSITAA